MDEEQIREIIRQEFAAYFKSDRMTIYKLLQFLDGRNVQLGTATGTKFGTATGQKLGFYNATPVNQPDTVSDPTITSISGSGADAAINTNFTNLDNAVETIIDRLQELGLIA